MPGPMNLQALLDMIKTYGGEAPAQAVVGAFDPSMAAALKAYGAQPPSPLTAGPQAPVPPGANLLATSHSSPNAAQMGQAVARLKPHPMAPMAPMAPPSGIPDSLKYAGNGAQPQNAIGGVGGQLFGRGNNLPNFLDANGPQQAPLDASASQDLSQLPQGAAQNLPPAASPQHNKFSSIMRAILGINS